MKRMWSKNELVRQVKEVKKDITTLVDAQGHDRFLTGDIEVEEITGITKVFAKWALSGAHLLIVIAINLADEAEISYQRLAYINVPQWIKDKIYDLASTGYVSKITTEAWDNTLGSQQVTAYLLKQDADNISVDISSITLTADRSCRIAFDLLID